MTPDDSKADVALNIFAKPFQTALSLLSLTKWSGSHIGEIWLQFEPMGSRFDSLPPYYIAEYLSSVLNYTVHISQPDKWLKRQSVTLEELSDPALRSSVRYQTAMSQSTARFLFITHNDVFILKDIIGDMLQKIDGAFAIGPLGQCWNCPASREDVTQKTMGCAPCSPLRQLEIRPTWEQLGELYATARRLGHFVRPYDENGFSADFRRQPWPLPECRINEWACLLNLDMSRSVPDNFPFGAFKDCGGHNLDTGVAWFRSMYAAGYQARNFDISKYLRHWVGTGHKRPVSYAYSEDRALGLLRKYFPAFVKWLENKTGPARGAEQ